ncbi:MAG TPA: ABC transporter permease [Terriglobales bacterium]|nr:ABC transporter permease [Terriglobales bacterium]
MRNIWLIIKREYLEKVRTKSFLISTLAMPIIIGIFILPGRMASMKIGDTRQIVIVTAERSLGEKIQQELERPSGKSEGEESARELTGGYKVEVSNDLSEAQRNSLRERTTRKEIDGYVWLGPEEIASRKVSYSRRETGDFMDQGAVRSAIRNALAVQALESHGVPPEQAADVLKPLQLEVVQVNGGQEKKVNATAAFAATFALVMLLYSTVLFYGIAVMRSVIEEKSSRIIEVLLSSVTPTELMMGKVIGVGAVGLTQIGMWAVMASIVAAPGAIAADVFRKAQISPVAIFSFAAFFLLGYFLYATIYAALGAVVNTEQEGQQMQIIIMLPLILALSLVMLVFRDPNGTVATWVSMIPLVAPVLMYLRIVIQTPPLWQIVLCLGIMVATVFGLLVLCSRIYRVGILMYGKRATLPEIMKWLKYAGV